MIDAVTYGMIPSAKIEKRESAPAREQGEQAEDAAGVTTEVVLNRGRVDAGSRHPRAQAVRREHGSGEEHPAPELRNPPRVGEPGKQELFPAFLLGLSRSFGRRCLSLGRALRLGFSLGLARRRALCFFAFLIFGSFSSVSVPPAASTFSRAVAEAACTVIFSFSESSPTPSSFTSLWTERISPFAFSDSGVTSSPAAKPLEIAEIDGLGVGAERADGHRVLRRRAAQLRDAHRQRHLAALEAGAHHVRARA